MPAPFPHRYTVRLTSRDALAGTGTIEAVGSTPIGVGPPPQFDGSDAWWSPEQLLLGAVAACHHSTIAAFARRKGLDLGAVSMAIEGILDKSKEGPRFSAIRLRIEILAPAPVLAEAEALVARAHSACIVANHLTVPVDVEIVAAADPDILRESRVVAQTVAALATLLPASTARAFAEALPPQLAVRAQIASGFDPSDTDETAFVTRVAQALGSTSDAIRAPVRHACREIAARLPPDLRERLRRQLPTSIGALLVTTGEPTSTPSPPAVAG